MPSNPFRVALSFEFRRQVRLLSKEARKSGRLAEFIAALEFVNRALQFNPRDWGDPLFHYHQLRLEMRHGIRNGYSFYFAVHLDQPEVFLERIRRISDL